MNVSLSHAAAMLRWMLKHELIVQSGTVPRGGRQRRLWTARGKLYTLTGLDPITTEETAR